MTVHVHRVTRGPVSVEETRSTDGVRITLEGDASYVVGLPMRTPVHAVRGRRELDSALDRLPSSHRPSRR